MTTMPSDELFIRAALSGFVLGLSMIFSIGPQNLQLIRAGAAPHGAAVVATIGYLSEIVIVLVGIHSAGVQLGADSEIGSALRGLGIVFLVWYGLNGIVHGGCRQAIIDITPTTTRRNAVVAMLTVTWLNPLVYVEVMFLVGVLSSAFGHVARLWFAVGFLAASAIRFYGWSIAGRLLRDWLSVPHHGRQFGVISGCLILCSAAILAAQMAHLL